MTFFKITKEIIGSGKKRTLYDGESLRDAIDTLGNIKRASTVVIDLPREVTIVDDEHPLGICYRIEEE